LSFINTPHPVVNTVCHSERGEISPPYGQNAVGSMSKQLETKSERLQPNSRLAHFSLGLPFCFSAFGYTIVIFTPLVFRIKFGEICHSPAYLTAIFSSSRRCLQEFKKHAKASRSPWNSIHLNETPAQKKNLHRDSRGVLRGGTS